MRVVRLSLCLLIFAFQGVAQQSRPIGYQDTPMLPGGKWHVHDSARPQPIEVTPGATCSQTTPDRLRRMPSSFSTAQTCRSGAPRTAAKPAGSSRKASRKYRLLKRERGEHLHARVIRGLPAAYRMGYSGPARRDVMNRGNSGIFFQGLYELQVFESYHGGIYADGQAAAIYGQYPPLVNASRPPGRWQVLMCSSRLPDLRERS